MYDELVKRLRVSVDGRYEKCDVCPYEEDYPCCVDCLDKMHKEAADAIEELQGKHFMMKKTAEWLAEKVPTWIPVTERLPEVRTWVLCYCRANSFDVFRMTDEGDWQYGNRSIYMKGYVTHWMPLPEPPKEE